MHRVALRHEKQVTPDLYSLRRVTQISMSATTNDKKLHPPATRQRETKDLCSAGKEAVIEIFHLFHFQFEEIIRTAKFTTKVKGKLKKSEI